MQSFHRPQPRSASLCFVTAPIWRAKHNPAPRSLCGSALARPEQDEGDGAQRQLAQRSTNFDDYVDDWWSFWNDEESSTAAFDEALEALEEEYGTATPAPNKQRVRNQSLALLQRLPYLQDNPQFVGQLPVPHRDQSLDTLPDPTPRERKNPDWDEWALRAYMEKRRAKRESDEVWHQRQAEVGRYSYLAPSWKNDVRLAGQDEREWTHEEILSLITQDGRAADPANVPLKCEDPEGTADYVGQGVVYIRETEEYLQDIGHWMENVNEDELDKEVTLLASEFADFEDGISPAGLAASGDAGGFSGDGGPPYDGAL